MKFFVEHEESRKRISCINLVDLHSQIRVKFLLEEGSYLLQQFDSDVNLFFDVDDDEDLEDSSRLKIVKKSNVGEPFACSSRDTSTAEQPIENENETNDFNMDSVNDNSDETSELPATSASEEASSSETNTSLEFVDKRPPWPIVFKIPKENFGKQLKEKLDTKQQLNEVMRTHLFDTIYDEASKYYDGNYPEPSQYVMMTKALLEDYPYLSGKAQYADALVSWKTKMGNRFRNNRKRNDRNSPYVKPRMEKLSKKRGSKKAGQQYTEEVQNIWGIKHFLPKRCEGEDDESIAEHMRVLSHQNKIVENARNKPTISISMDKTFPERRKFILDGGIKPIRTIKLEYPLLFTCDQVLAEFKRLTGLDLMETLSTGLKRYSNKLIGFKPKKNEIKVIGNLRTKMKSANILSRKEYFELACAFSLIPYQLRENIADIFIFQDDIEVSSFPRIKLEEEPLDEEAKFRVVVEGELLSVSHDLLTAYGTVFAAYYMFNLSYPDKLKSSMNFIQRAIFGFVDRSTKDAKVSRLLTTLLSE